MSYSRVLLAGLCISNILIFSGYAAAATLNLKTGLWEFATTGESSGAPPIPDDILARMPPEQRAKFDAAMAANATRAKAPRLAKHCLTEKSLQRGIKLDDNKGGSTCTQTVVSNSASLMDVRQECTGREQMSGHFHFEAVSPVAMTGTIDVTVTNGARTMISKYVMHGKWLGDDCGSLKKADD